MATHHTAIIPYNRLIKIGIWSNQKAKTTLSNVYTQLKDRYPGKEIYISNAGFFNMNSNLTPCFGLKANNIVYADNWNMYYMGMKGNTIKFCYGPKEANSYTDIVSGSPPLIENGKKSAHFTYCIDNSNRGRTMLGYNKEGVILSCIADVSGTSDFTLDEEIAYMLKLNCSYAINLDGGGSTQCNFNGKIITSSRKVSNFIYMVVEPEKATVNTTTTVIVSQYKVGDLIRIQQGATYTSGKKIPTWVLNSALYCRQINSNNTIAFSTSKTGAITGIVSTRFVEGKNFISSDIQTIITNPIASPPQTDNFKVKITANVLNMRKGPNTSYDCIGKAYKNEIYEITLTKNNWGQIKNTEKWISLNYTKKI